MIELLVAISIVSLLIALTMPAVQVAREASRRLGCCNNLRQIGIALHSYSASYGVFPALRVGFEDLEGGPGRLDDFSPFARLLPYLGEAAVYNSLNFSADGRQFSPGGARRDTAFSASISTFLCPSDPGVPAAGSSYRFSMGSLVMPHPMLPGSGAFPARRFLAASEFSDGLSFTAGLSEKLAGSGGRYEPVRDLYLVGEPATASDSITMTFWINQCASLVTHPTAYDSSYGRSWFIGSQLLYNHILAPNHPIVDCGVGGFIPTVGLLTARSWHSASVNVLMMDGTVRSIGDGIDGLVWRALGSRAGGETIPSESF